MNGTEQGGAPRQENRKRGGDRRSREYQLNEDQRWEKVFQRLVDPDYYRRRPLSLPSSFPPFAERMEVLCAAR